MSTDLLPKTQGPPETHSRPPRQAAQRRGDPSGFLTWPLVAAWSACDGCGCHLGDCVALIAGGISSQETGPKLTHTITRGDLLVTVTEQGTLESSNNTEIKCKVRGFSTVTWVIPGGTVVKPGDELVRLDTKVIEEQFSLTKTNTHIATATLEETKANVAKAEIAIDAYKEGRFRSQLQSLEKELEIAKRNLRTAQEMLDHSETLFKQGYVTESGG